MRVDFSCGGGYIFDFLSKNATLLFHDACFMALNIHICFCSRLLEMTERAQRYGRELKLPFSLIFCPEYGWVAPILQVLNLERENEKSELSQAYVHHFFQNSKQVTFLLFLQPCIIDCNLMHTLFFLAGICHSFSTNEYHKREP